MSSNKDEIRQSLLALDPATRYAVRVRSVDGLGNKSPWSEAIEFDTTASSAVPNTPTGFSYRWTGRDIYLSWAPPISNTDGSATDISHYEVVPILNFIPPSTLIAANRYLAGSTNFTYTAEMMYADFGEYDENAIFVIVAVDRNGLKSRFDVSVVVEAAHPIPATPPAPKIFDVGGQLLVQMTKGTTQCFESFELTYSSDGGSSYWPVPGSPLAEEIYVFTPETSDTHYFRYRVNCIFGESSYEFGAAGYGSTTVAEEGPTAQTIVSRSSSFTIQAEDIGTLQKCTNGLFVTLPNQDDEAIAVGQRVDFIRYTSDEVAIVGDTGVTVHSPNADPVTLRETYSMCSAIKVDTNVWVVAGDTTA